MKLAIVGLGRMGMNMARRLIRGGHQVVAYNRTSKKTDTIVEEGAIGVYALSELKEKLPAPRVVWLMLPAGPAVDDHIGQLKGILSPGDIVIDGGNTYYKDDLRRAELLAERDIQYMDAGVSGGIWGLEIGYCLMVGGNKKIYQYLEPIFETLAPKDGYLYCGANGAGHFVKMVHNGIEYGMMQAYGEGFEILEASPYSESLNYAEVAHLWNQGSVVRSWLLELAEAAFNKDARLTDILGYVEDSGEGRWTVAQAVESGVPAPVITLSLMQRFRSRETESFSDKVLAALRREFGGHAVVKADKKEKS
ncbi:MAG: decarboxylating 6-phosphogluconate dehydrogenase [Deltaproteobacteria bacterium]|nr:decarboxylating 6-phosphogluconate dehydrogenase [Deltaproteobacteria bacterium]MBW2052398.1 decarboxylating 6-phosphogluconate dehydrogenase [Deltaproteobacteria bacterium]MBW2141468.1 decarboxylating 6-phosphogluconate dehydrogenase [Deltaproteobacteria bacterium]MBW2323113.1 decarboxylating 6-phosphogluconate dehydrogenase [Deltaproteobacteria bacterium]